MRVCRLFSSRVFYDTIHRHVSYLRIFLDILHLKKEEYIIFINTYSYRERKREREGEGKRERKSEGGRICVKTKRRRNVDLTRFPEELQEMILHSIFSQQDRLPRV